MAFATNPAVFCLLRSLTHFTMKFVVATFAPVAIKADPTVGSLPSVPLLVLK